MPIFISDCVKAMPIRHLLLALLVVAVWGFNFIFIKLGLAEMSPLLLCAARFLFASVPAIFFIKPPAIPFKVVALYGLITFALQFSFLFIGMQVGMTPGLASLLMQTQVFFSILFAVIFLEEMPNIWQVIGAIISFTGIGLVAMHLDKHISLAGFILIIASAASWGLGNLVSKKMKNVNMISLVVWGSFVAFFPLLLISLIFDGPNSLIYSVKHISWVGVSAVLYIVLGATWVGYGIWNWLLSRYPVTTVAPFTLLVPVFGILSSVLLLNEPFYRWKFLAGLLVITGLCINLLGTRFSGRRNAERVATEAT